MVVGEVASSTDVLVIGGGPGGYTAALRCAALGLDVTLIERQRLGGVCLNVGCIPSKALIHAADVFAMAGPDALPGIDLRAELDMARVRGHIGEIVRRLHAGVESLLAEAGVEVLQGTARFSKSDRAAVELGDEVRHFEFAHAIVATGSRPVEIPSLSWSDPRVLSSTEALFLEEVPESMVVVGGGYIGVELGTAWRKLGSQVTIVEEMDSLLPLMPRRLTRFVERRLDVLGVAVKLGARASRLVGDGLEVETAGEVETVATGTIVVAVGRRPNTEDLGLALAGAELTESGHIAVDLSRRASPTVLAVGDVTEGPALAHKAIAEAEVAAMTAAGRPAAFEPSCIPEVVFSDPEVVKVGVDLEEAEQEGLAAHRARFSFSASGRALTLGRPEGVAEIISDSEGTVIGVCLVGPSVAELSGEAALAVEMAATVEDLALTIHAHPTLSEALNDAARGGVLN